MTDTEPRVLFLTPRMWRRKRRCDWVVKDAFWRGFQDGVSESFRSSLEYSSTSGLYGYNPAHKIAYQRGYETGQELLRAHDERRKEWSDLDSEQWPMRDRLFSRRLAV